MTHMLVFLWQKGQHIPCNMIGIIEGQINLYDKDDNLILSTNLQEIDNITLSEDLEEENDQ